MAENGADKKYRVPSVVISTPIRAVVVDDRIKLVDETADDLAAIEEANRSGASTNYDDFRRELGL